MIAEFARLGKQLLLEALGVDSGRLQRSVNRH
jgi:hypothetical protein